ncbi:MAG: DUF2244 domain-containing protein [Proteobacteria bacterium]|nr:DUF2244 domain-containing protein [Pseudomonadota bacterium]
MKGWIQELPRQEFAFQGRGPGFSLLLKRNCSISPAGLMWAYGAIAAVTLGVAAAFAVLGAWMVLPFAGIEVVALGIAFAMNGRHAADYERIQLAGGRLLVEVCESDSVRRHEFNPARASVMVAGAGHGMRIMLESPGRSLEIGRHLHERARLELAGELNRRLRN